MKLRTIISFAVGPIGAALLGFITLPVITWFFSSADIGRIALLHVVLSFGVLLFSMGLDQAYVREYHEDPNRPTLLKVTLLPGFGLLLMALALTMVEPTFLSRMLFGLPEVSYSILVAVCVLASFTSRFLSLILRMQERGLAYSMSQVLPKVVFLALVGLYVLFADEFNFVKLLVGHTVSLLTVVVIYSWNTRQDWLLSVRAPFSVERFKFLLSYSSPLILASLAFWGLTAMDKLFLRGLSSFEELGVYSVAVSFAAAATIVQTIFSTIWAPLVYKWAAAGINEDKVRQVIGYVLAVVLGLFAAAGLFSWIILYLLPEQYVEVQYLVVACMAFPLLYALSEATKVGIGIQRKTKLSMIAAVVAALLNLVGNYLLIPILGAQGAALSTAVAFFVFFVLRTEFAIRVWIPLPRLLLYAPTGTCVILSILMVLYGEHYANLLRIAFAAIALFALALFWRTHRSGG
ncbi:lipopolysaccharide biosynthesis protein [Pseudidiomarina insulisalsae]|uniref:Polysaccharide biosynthesis protein n=1 Tax=Pseudidiomarina insulisalsae TaxID=575789 RepID=A0A432YNQ6_9GAMM|nr:oligosaccharide flippase family protein [Pseudidiomarina insulisalsae]RUO62631.1 polysaccharide biosynthesis protein [Pseudidiomarina insulisalsae]